MVVSDFARNCWILSLKEQHKLVKDKRRPYWMAKSIHSLIRKLSDGRLIAFCVVSYDRISSSTVATITGDFFHKKLNNIRAATV